MNLLVDGRIYLSKTKGGVARIFNNILPIICDLDSEILITLFFTNQPQIEYPEHRQIRSLNLKRVNYLRPNRLFAKVNRQLQLIELMKYVQNTEDHIWISTYYTSPSFFWKGKKVQIVYDLIYEKFPDQLQNSSKVIRNKSKAINDADLIFCISNSTANDLLNYYHVGDNKVQVSYLSHNEIFEVRSERKIECHMPFKFILYVGNRGSYKNFKTLLTAYHLWSKNNEIKLVVVGPSFTDSEMKEVRAFGLETNVINLHSMDDNQLCDLYNQAQAFVYPSLYEGFGIPLLEAMACGCLIIASKIPSTLEVAKDIPIYFVAEDVNSLLHAFDRLSSTNGHQQRIRRGIELSNQYSWKLTATKILDGLKSV